MQIVNLALIASSVLAHFDLLRPQVRINDLDTMNESPCGGSNTPAQRTSFPIVGGLVGGQGYHRNSRTYYKLSLKEAPTTNGDFNLILHPDTFAERSGPFQVGPLDLSNLPGVRNGVVGTIQVSTFDSHDWSYQCADVVFQGASAPGSPSASPSTAPSPTNRPPTNTGTPSSPSQAPSAPSNGTAVTTSVTSTTAATTTSTSQPVTTSNAAYKVVGHLGVVGLFAMLF
jgi:hypothetical protein